MAYFISFIVSALGSLASWFAQKGVTKSLIFVALKSVSLLVFGIFLAALYFAFSFVTNMYTILKDFVTNFNSYYGSVSIGGNDVVQLFYGFMDASGVGLAFTTVLNLYITIMLFKLSLYLYKVFSIFTFAVYFLYSDFVKSILK